MEFWSEPVANLPLQEALTVSPDDAIVDVIRRMQAEKRGCACVVDEAGKLSGIFTERDVMHKFVGQSVDRNEAVRAVMTPKPFIVRADAPLSEAVEIFHDERIHHLPVISESGGVLGLLSIRKVVDFFSENLSTEVLNLPPDSSIVSTEASGG